MYVEYAFAAFSAEMSVMNSVMVRLSASIKCWLLHLQIMMPGNRGPLPDLILFPWETEKVWF